MNQKKKMSSISIKFHNCRGVCIIVLMDCSVMLISSLFLFVCFSPQLTIVLEDGPCLDVGKGLS